MSYAKFNRERIQKYLLKTQPEEFTAGDIAKALNLTARSVGGLIKDIPEIKIKNRRKYAHTESGNRYCLVKNP